MLNAIMMTQIAVIQMRLVIETCRFGSRLRYFLQTPTSTQPETSKQKPFQSAPPPFGVAEETGPNKATSPPKIMSAIKLAFLCTQIVTDRQTKPASSPQYVGIPERCSNPQPVAAVLGSEEV
jgi:hypothetical protein